MQMWMNNMISLAVNIIDGFLFLEIAKRMNQPRFHTVWASIGFSLIYSVVTVTVSHVGDWFLPWWLLRLFMVLFDYLMMLIYFKKRLMGILSVAVYLLISFLTELASIFVMGLFPVADSIGMIIDDPILSGTVAVTSRLLGFSIVFVASSIWGRDMVLKRVSRYQCLFFLLTVVIMINSAALFVMISHGDEITRGFMTYHLAAMLLFTAVSGWVFHMIIKSGKAEERRALERQQQELEHEFVSMTQTYLNDLRFYRHDYRNSLTAIQALLKEENYQAAKDYFEEMRRDFQAHNIEFIDNMPAVSALLIRKQNAAGNLGIDFRYKLPRTVRGGIQELDLNRILYNLVDNAFEAAEKGEAGDRWVELEVFEKNTDLFIVCKNPITSELSAETGTLKTTKKKNRQEHGLGLMSVRELTAKYDGDVLIETGRQIFQVSVMLSLIPEEAGCSDAVKV